METMVGTVLRGSRLPVVCGVLLTAAALAGGCARVVTGAAQAGDPQVRPSRPIPMADLLIEPTRFPAHYAAAVVPPKDMDRVMGEIDGVAAGSEVTPPECAPLPVLTDQQAAVQGTDERERCQADRHGHPAGAVGSRKGLPALRMPVVHQRDGRGCRRCVGGDRRSSARAAGGRR